MKEKCLVTTNGTLKLRSKKKYQLTLFNDDVNSFDDVITLLTEVLDHNQYQAEQCATIVHHVGRVVVKYGKKDMLLFYKNLLSNQGLTVKIEATK
jgi:ATP-dependent Clp protease adaptor protein ClpS